MPKTKLPKKKKTKYIGYGDYTEDDKKDRALQKQRGRKKRAAARQKTVVEDTQP